MNGLNKILERISLDYEKEADDIMAAASKEAAEIKVQTDKKIATECSNIRKKTDSEVKAIKERSIGAADLAKRQIILKGKQEIINEVISKARDRLYNMSDNEYQSFIADLLIKHVPDEDAVLKFNKQDEKRIPKSVTDDFISRALKNKATVTVDFGSDRIKNGFILDFGGIEENCTFDALIDQNIEKLEDEVSAILFSKKS